MKLESQYKIIYVENKKQHTINIECELKPCNCETYENHKSIYQPHIIVEDKVLENVEKYIGFVNADYIVNDIANELKEKLLNNPKIKIKNELIK